MRIAISNIAWETSDDELVASLLKKHDIDAIDIAPGKYFPEPGRASSEEISRVRDWWKSRGFDITGMQSLLFGTSGLNLFGSDDIRSAMLDRLAAVCRGDKAGIRFSQKPGSLGIDRPRNTDCGRWLFSEAGGYRSSAWGAGLSGA